MDYPRHYYLKKLLWKVFGCDRVPASHGIYSKLRETFGRCVYGPGNSDKGYHSQGGQDAYLDKLVFSGKRDGVFAEVGANDGLTFSNTYYFEKELNWSGLCVEPNPAIFPLLKENRKAFCVQACAGATPGEVDFPIVKDAEHSLYARASSGSIGTIPVVRVPKETLSELFDASGLSRIDYLSIDTEGGELDTFCALDLNRFHVDVVSLEENEDALTMDRRMKDLGYRFLAHVFTDRLYRRNRA